MKASVLKALETRPGKSKSGAFSIIRPRAANAVRQIEALHAGLPASQFEKLRRHMDLSAGELSKVTRIAIRTVSRRKREGRLSTDESERLLRVGLLFDRACEVFEDELRARRWMKAPNLALGGNTPLEFADTEPGAREVSDVLGRIEHGIFT